LEVAGKVFGCVFACACAVRPCSSSSNGDIGGEGDGENQERGEKLLALPALAPPRPRPSARAGACLPGNSCPRRRSTRAAHPCVARRAGGRRRGRTAEQTVAGWKFLLWYVTRPRASRQSSVDGKFIDWECRGPVVSYLFSEAPIGLWASHNSGSLLPIGQRCHGGWQRRVWHCRGRSTRR